MWGLGRRFLKILVSGKDAVEEALIATEPLLESVRDFTDQIGQRLPSNPFLPPCSFGLGNKAHCQNRPCEICGNGFF